jgi:hypothetical protein
MHNPASFISALIGARRTRIVTILGMTGVVLVGTAAPGSAAVIPATLTLSATQGPNTGGNTITAITPPGSPQFSPGVAAEFQAVGAAAAATCTPNYAPAVPPSSTVGGILEAQGVMVISPNRVSINVPDFKSALLTNRYNVCIYSANNATGQLLAQTAAAGQYTIGTKVFVQNVWPVAGPSQGGTTITVYGNNFPTATTSSGAATLTATLGGLPLLNLNVISPQQFTAVTPARSPSATPVPLIVTSASGTTVLGKAFTFANGVAVSPSTAPNIRMGNGTPVDVQGIGFGGLSFQMTGNPDDKNAHVYLVRGMYDPTPSSANSATKRNGELVECANATIVSDTELICTMNLQASLNNAGATALPNRPATTAETHQDNTLTSIAPPLSDSDKGLRISGTGIQPGTVITAVTNNGTSATLSIATQGTPTAGVSVVVGAGTQTAVVNGPPSSPSSNPVAPLTTLSPPLTNTDIGRVVTGTNIPPGTVIVGLNNDGSSAYLSAPPTSVGAGQSSSTITISEPVPVPLGTYTLTVVSNGTVGAWPADAGYTQSVISGASTFTVSDF